MKDAYWEMHDPYVREVTDEPLERSLRGAVGEIAFSAFLAADGATREVTERATRDAIDATNLWAIQDLEAFVREGGR